MTKEIKRIVPAPKSKLQLQPLSRGKPNPKQGRSKSEAGGINRAETKKAFTKQR